MIRRKGIKALGNEGGRSCSLAVVQSCGHAVVQSYSILHVLQVFILKSRY